MFGTHGFRGRRANSVASADAVSVILGPTRMFASESCRTFPTGNHREKTHGHTDPSGAIATLPSPH